MIAILSVLFALMACRSKPSLWRYWGYGVLAVLLLSLGSNAFGPGIYAVLVGLLILFVLFQAPVYCGAINRKRGGAVEFCRNNSTGLVMGCHLRQHRWQKFGHDWWSLGWRRSPRAVWTGASAKLATVSGLVGTVTGIIGVFKIVTRLPRRGGGSGQWPARSAGTSRAQLTPASAVNRL